MIAQRTRLRAPRAGGFTLVELLIVVVILGVLASIVVFAVGNLTTTAASHSCAAEAETFSKAVQEYKTLNTGSLPAGAVAAAVATTLAGANLLAGATLGFNGAANNQWSYATGTGVVTKGSACS